MMMASMHETKPTIYNGTYTVSHPSGHYTVKLETVNGGKLDGKRIVSVLVGSDNENDYQGIAFWDDSKRRAFLFRKFRTAGACGRFDGKTWDRIWNKTERKLAVWLDLTLNGEGGHWYRKGCRVQESRRCLKCNRRLSTPWSIEFGIGPVCAGRRSNR